MHTKNPKGSSSMPQQTWCSSGADCFFEPRRDESRHGKCCEKGHLDGKGAAGGSDLSLDELAAHARPRLRQPLAAHVPHLQVGEISAGSEPEWWVSAQTQLPLE